MEIIPFIDGARHGDDGEVSNVEIYGTPNEEPTCEAVKSEDDRGPTQSHQKEWRV